MRDTLKQTEKESSTEPEKHHCVALVERVGSWAEVLTERGLELWLGKLSPYVCFLLC